MFGSPTAANGRVVIFWTEGDVDADPEPGAIFLFLPALAVVGLARRRNQRP